MTDKATSRIVAGLEEAAEYARVKRAVFEWIRDDAPLAVQMSLYPKHWNKLIDRICGTHTREVEVSEG